MKINKKLLKGSVILLVSFGVYNFLNFMFHFSMARILSIADFGILAALFSIVYILSLFAESIQTIITKYVSSETDSGKIKNVLKRSLKKALKISVALFVLYALISIPLASLLKIPYSLVLLTGLMVFIVFTIPLTRGILQGKKQFSALGFNMILEGLLKVGIAVLLALIGWRVYGAILGLIAGTFIALILSFIPLRKILSSKEKRAKTKEIYKYSTPTFVIIFTILVFFSIDVIMAKIVFSPNVAGAYAIASILGKTIFFGTNPISRAMFSFSSSEKNKKKYENLFFNALIITLLGIFAALIIFFFFSDLIVSIFSGKNVPLADSILFYLGIAISLISLANLNLLYKLSIGKTKGFQYLPLFILIEIVLLWYFSANLFQFSLAFINASAIFLWFSTVILGKE